MRTNVLWVFLCLILPNVVFGSGDDPSQKITSKPSSLKKEKEGLVPDPDWVPEPGDRAQIYDQDGTESFGCVGLQEYHEYMKLALAHDRKGLVELIEKKALVSVEDRIKILVIEEIRDQPTANSSPILVIRVLEGALEGEKLWISRFAAAQLIAPKKVAPKVEVAPRPLPQPVAKTKSGPVPKAVAPRAISPAALAADSLQHGKNLRFNGNREPAIEYFRKAIKQAPDSPAGTESKAILKSMGVAEN